MTTLPPELQAELIEEYRLELIEARERKPPPAPEPKAGRRR